MQLNWIWIGWNQERRIYSTIHQITREGKVAWRVNNGDAFETLAFAKGAVWPSEWTAHAVGQSGTRHTIYRDMRSGQWRAYSGAAFDNTPHMETAFAFCENQERLALAMQGKLQ